MPRASTTRERPTITPFPAHCRRASITPPTSVSPRRNPLRSVRCKAERQRRSTPQAIAPVDETIVEHSNTFAVAQTAPTTVDNTVVASSRIVVPIIDDVIPGHSSTTFDDPTVDDFVINGPAIENPGTTMDLVASSNNPIGDNTMVLDNLGGVAGSGNVQGSNSILTSTLAPLPDLERDLEDLKTHIHQVTRCTLCNLFMRRPFVLTCGHSFCAPCLRTYFQTSLREKLANLHYLPRHSILYDYQRAPTSHQQHNYLATVLLRHSTPPESVFTYHCPTRGSTCSAAITLPPVESLAMKDLIEAADHVISENQAAGAQRQFCEEQGVVTLGYFNGLFYLPFRRYT